MSFLLGRDTVHGAAGKAFITQNGRVIELFGAKKVDAQGEISSNDMKVIGTKKIQNKPGGDTVTARFLNENSFEFMPQFKLFVNTNHLPKVTEVTVFHSGRVKVIPFERHFTEAGRDASQQRFILNVKLRQ